MDKHIIENYVAILNEELVLAMGCTEPISIAYCAATARNELGNKPDKMIVRVSGNMLKNAKGVIIPNTTSLRGVKASAIIGALGGDPSKKLEVLSGIDPQYVTETIALEQTDYCEVITIDPAPKLYVEVTVMHQEDTVTVEIKHQHTNISKIEKNGVSMYINNCDDDDFNTPLTTRELLNIKSIYEFSTTYDYSDLEPLLKMQIDMNMAIAEKGLRYDYGLNVGSTILKHIQGDNIISKAKAYTAAGSDARMSGSTMPVMTNSGSGNQGMTASIPIAVYAQYLRSSQDDLYRALILSNLIAIHIKTRLGRLSAFCGAVVAATGSAAGIAYLDHCDYECIVNAIKIILANISGVFCDGAKPSCASKIASSIDAAFQAKMIAEEGYSIQADTGIISDDIEETIQNVGDIGYKAMSETDRKIIEIMSQKK